MVGIKYLNQRLNSIDFIKYSSYTKMSKSGVKSLAKYVIDIAKEGAIVKVAGMNRLLHRGPARVFNNEEEAYKAVENKQYKEGGLLRLILNQ